MVSELKILKIKDFFKKDSTILFLIIFLSYILRILPYLFGYSIPFTEDGLRDFQQVKYIIDNNHINFFTSYQSYGAFPILHLLVVIISYLGLDPLKVFLFFPQILSSLGLIFYYLFLKKYFNNKQSLLACFLIAVFIPHIHWSAQPVRETLGLFLFPLIIYLFNGFITEKKISIKYFSLLILSLILIIPTHHWSAIMVMVWLVAFSFFFTTNIKKIIISLLITIFFVVFNLIYWHYFFPLSFTLIGNLISHIDLIQIVMVLLLFLLIWIFKKADLNKLKNQDNKRNSFLLIIILLWLMAKNMLPLNYPIQIWLHFLMFITFIFIGFFYNKDRNLNKFFAVAIFYSYFILIVLVFNFFNNINIYSLPFDPFRTFEFAIFPLSIVAAMGLLNILSKNHYLKVAIIVILIVSATFAYPPIFIYGKTFINTPFYDIRSNIRYISAGEMDLIKWANDHGYNVEANRPEIRSYQATFYKWQNKKITIITSSDKILQEKYSYIYDPIIRVEAYENKDLNQNQILYQNNDGLLIDLRYNASFVSQNIPEKFPIGQEVNMIVKIKNTGSLPWLKADKYHLRSNDDIVVIPLKRDVLPDEIITFQQKMLVPNLPGVYGATFRMHREETGFFGEYTPQVQVTVE